MPLRCHLTRAGVQAAFLYDRDTGTLFDRQTGLPLGKPRKGGHLTVATASGHVMATHVIWLLAYGYLPQRGRLIEHVNGNVADNRLSNLREVTWSELRAHAKLRAALAAMLPHVQRAGRRHHRRVGPDRAAADAAAALTSRRH